MDAALLYEVVDENMGEEERMAVSDLNDKMGSPWDDAELASRLNDLPRKDGEGFGTDITFGNRIVYRTC